MRLKTTAPTKVILCERCLGGHPASMGNPKLCRLCFLLDEAKREAEQRGFANMAYVIGGMNNMATIREREPRGTKQAGGAK
jgi:hypothetical protein